MKAEPLTRALLLWNGCRSRAWKQPLRARLSGTRRTLRKPSAVAIFADHSFEPLAVLRVRV